MKNEKNSVEDSLTSSIVFEKHKKNKDSIVHREMVRQFVAQAGPNMWGVWYTIGSHVGTVSYDISYRGISEATKVYGKVRYFSNSGKKEQEFIDSVTILCGNAVDNVEVCFMGIPTGSAVEGTIVP
ncbi:hypothetical protein [Niallia circulans]|uniref:hypothetical protein n=1 Tax=Niallia circulans TaxID=1397 RepID=UPI0026EB804E|nr:hypothetical protein [Niallia circulans]